MSRNIKVNIKTVFTYFTITKNTIIPTRFTTNNTPITNIFTVQKFNKKTVFDYEKRALGGEG